MTPYAYFAIGETASTMQNIEYIIGKPPHVLPTAVVPLSGPNRRRLASGRVRSDGQIDAKLLWDRLDYSDYVKLIQQVFGGFTTGSKLLYVTSIDESRHYSTFIGYFNKPSIAEEEFEVANGGGEIKLLTISLTNCNLISITRSANAIVGLGDRFTRADSTSGNITLTLPAIAGVAPYTIYSVMKMVAANSVVIDGNGAETIEGSATLTLTTRFERVDLYSDGTQWRLVSYG